MTNNVQTLFSSHRSARTGPLPHRWLAVLVLGLLLAAGGTYSTFAQTTTIERLESPNPRTDGRYGFSVDLDAVGNRFMVGAYQEGANVTNPRGRAYIYGLSATGPSFLEATLTPPAGGINGSAQWGRTVAVGTSVYSTSYFVGAPLDDNDALFSGTGVDDTGSWSRYELTSGTYSRIRTYELGTRDLDRRLFSIGLALDGTTLAAGASTSASSGSPGGRVYIRNITGLTSGSNGAVLSSPSPQANAQFGRGLALDGDRLVITALNYDSGGLTNRGDAYVFLRNTSTSTWSVEQQLVPTGLTDGAQYGRAAAIDGNLAFISASGQDAGSTPGAGAVYVWERDPSTGTWTNTQTLTASTPETGSIYGYDLTYDAATAVLYVGAPREDVTSPTALTDAGVVYAYELNGSGVWQETLRFASTNPQADALFGVALHAEDDQLVASAYNENIPDGNGGTITNAGAVYLYQTASALPVELAAFDAQSHGSTVNLQWRTLSETNNAGFHVEHRAPEAARFQNVGFVAGSGTTDESQSYTLRIHDLNTGTHAFRLRQVDLDGTEEYSPTITAEVRGTPGVASVWPNPVRTRAKVAVTLDTPGRVTATVYDVLGRRVRTVYDASVRSGTITLNLTTKSLASGLYLLRVQTPGGASTRRFMVAR